jgi:hypothetical protein
MQLSAVIASVMAFGLAILAMVMLRDQLAASPEGQTEAEVAGATTTPCGQLETATR